MMGLIGWQHVGQSGREVGFHGSARNQPFRHIPGSRAPGRKTTLLSRADRNRRRQSESDEIIRTSSLGEFLAPEARGRSVARRQYWREPPRSGVSHNSWRRSRLLVVRLRHDVNVEIHIERNRGIFTFHRDEHLGEPLAPYARSIAHVGVDGHAGFHSKQGGSSVLSANSGTHTVRLSIHGFGFAEEVPHDIQEYGCDINQGETDRDRERGDFENGNCWRS